MVNGREPDTEGPLTVKITDLEKRSPLKSWRNMRQGMRMVTILRCIQPVEEAERCMVLRLVLLLCLVYLLPTKSAVSETASGTALF